MNPSYKCHCCNEQLENGDGFAFHLGDVVRVKGIRIIFGNILLCEDCTKKGQNSSSPQTTDSEIFGESIASYPDIDTAILSSIGALLDLTSFTIYEFMARAAELSQLAWQDYDRWIVLNRAFWVSSITKSNEVAGWKRHKQDAYVGVIDTLVAKVPCRICGTEILERTASGTGGLCRRCLYNPNWKNQTNKHNADQNKPSKNDPEGKTIPSLDSFGWNNWQSSFLDRLPNSDEIHEFDIMGVLSARMALTLLIGLICIVPIALVTLSILIYSILPETGNFWLVIRLSFLGSLVTLAVVVILTIFRHSKSKNQGIQLTEDEAPGLFDIINGLSILLDVPPPLKLITNTYVNASVTPTGGLRGIQRGEYVLTIGLPLIATMNTQALASIVAHELGHIKQYANRRVSYPLRRISVGLFEMAYRAPMLKETMASIAAAGCGSYLIFPLALLLLFTAAIGITFGYLLQLILRPLARIALAISFRFLRAQEYESDRLASVTCGSKVFESSLRMVAVLSKCYEMVIQNISFTKDNSPPEDLIASIASKLQEVEPTIAVDPPWTTSANTIRFSAHPDDSDRVRYLRALHTEGLPFLKVPAKTLVNSIKTLSLSTSGQLIHKLKNAWRYQFYNIY